MDIVVIDPLIPNLKRRKERLLKGDFKIKDELPEHLSLCLKDHLTKPWITPSVKQLFISYPNGKKPPQNEIIFYV